MSVTTWEEDFESDGATLRDEEGDLLGRVYPAVGTGFVCEYGEEEIGTARILEDGKRLVSRHHTAALKAAQA